MIEYVLFIYTTSGPFEVATTPEKALCSEWAIFIGELGSCITRTIL